MVRLAVSSMFFHEYTLDEIFDFVAEAGLDTLEFWVETPDFWLRGQPLPELISCLSSRPALHPLTMHAPILDLNPCSINPRVAEASVEYCLASLMIAERIGAEVLTVHPGRRTAKRPPGAADFRRFDHYLSLLESAARRTSVRVSIENMEKKVNSLLCTPESVREILDREHWLSFTLDVSHALGVSLEEVATYIDLCGERLGNVHLSGANGGTMHLPVEDNPDITTILHLLSDAGYQGVITFEFEDRNFNHDLSSEEKILFLARQAAVVRESLG
ncbi:MAG TPA: sugar phosphate isomerase/epimerase family protein [Methanoregulaceae archaeon]|nr:sugar phosphate isomerase/epimerase family protein [Methanoregulaceae archaeon]HOW32939.1 sugar phosphate isomerase/epimerase family protein [Methanoregulaceae archaeon]